jgi:hypothetical protein
MILKKLNFGVLTMEMKTELKNSGRLVPILNIVQEQKQYKNKAAFTRRFNKNKNSNCIDNSIFTLLFKPWLFSE